MAIDLCDNCYHLRHLHGEENSPFQTGCAVEKCNCEEYSHFKNRAMIEGAEMVNHPAHYTDGVIEVWDFILDKDLSYCLGNVVKYVSRAGKKDPNKTLEDLKKAKAYLEREIKRVESSP